MRFGEYEKIDVLGNGASGFVYKVQREGFLYAVKACTGFDKESLKRFEREIRIAQSLKHPNIIQVYDYDMNASNPYFVMDLCDGPISHFISGKSFEEILNLSVQICLGIKALHNHSILHRDIKPANVLIKGGEVKITDFSFGFFLNHDSTTVTSSHQVIGTQGYIAPEIFNEGAHRATVMSDIYSLGCTLKFLFSGGIQPQFCKPKDLPPKVVHIIERCEEKDPSLRYQTVQDLIDELEVFRMPIQFMSIKELIEQQSRISSASFRDNAYRLLMDNKRWDELIRDLRLLGIGRIKIFIDSIPNDCSELLLLLEDLYYNDKDTWKQFEDVDIFTDVCCLIFNSTTDLLTKEKAIGMSLEFSITFNRYPAMRVIKDSMLGKLSEGELRQLSGFLMTQKNKLVSMEEALGTKLSRGIRMAAGMA